MSEDKIINRENSRIIPSLYDRNGQRKYLTGNERKLFMRSAKKREDVVYTLCWLVHDTGCRISEALALTVNCLDKSNGVIVFESLKKRRAGVFRAVPISDSLIAQLERTFDLTNVDKSNHKLWSWCRMTAYRRMKSIFREANVIGVQATPKGLRHGFAVSAIEKGIPLNLIQRWLGHADLSTTAIYADAVGGEERNIAKKMWR